MESIGEKLKTAREEKGYSPDQVARDTNIARRFILAMENEDFEAFPGDTYLIGFLRNYADYLGLDPDRVVNLYRNMKIQEQPIPMEELIRGRRKGPGARVMLFILLGITVLAGGGFGIYAFLQKAPDASETVVEDQNEAPDMPEAENRYEMREEIVARRFGAGHSVLVHMSEDSIPVSIDEIGEKVTLASPSGKREIGLGESVSLDLTLDGEDDLIVEVQDIDSAGGTAVIRFDRGVGRTRETQEGTEAVVADEASTVEYTETASVPERERETLVLATGENPEPFRLNVVFRGYSLVRYLKDREIREQRYFNKDDSFQLDVDREVMLWISNAGTFKAQISGRELSFGGLGEVSARLIRWEQEEDTGLFQLKMIPVY